jgi:penicillin G amidase
MVIAASGTRPKGHEVTAVPSMRMVVDLANVDDSRWINLTGVSRHAFPRRLHRQTELWARGETLPWPRNRAAVESRRGHTFTLAPAKRQLSTVMPSTVMY